MMLEKLKFMFIYFKNAIKEVESDLPQRLISMYRNFLPEKNYQDRLVDNKLDFAWVLEAGSADETQNYDAFTEVTLESKKKIEDFQGPDSILADFANKYIGGGAAEWGCVQEEILFLVYPELFVSCVLFECMKDNEAILIKGVRQFAEYHGYGQHLLFK